VSGLLALDEADLRGLAGYARRMVGNDAEDAVQDALIRCWKAERRGQTVERGYVFLAVRSRCLEVLRRRARIPFCPLEAVAPPAAHDAVLDIPIADELIAAAGLTEQQRHVLRLVADGWRVTEIAEELGMHYSAVSKIMGRIRRRFTRMAA
jgi:RNA polymerase sigma factor (sigma-70 family)